VLVVGLREGVVHNGQAFVEDVVDDLFDHGVDQHSNTALTAHIRHRLVIVSVPPRRGLVVKQIVLVGETAHLLFRHFSEGQVAPIGDEGCLAAGGCVLRQFIDPRTGSVKTSRRGHIEDEQGPMGSLVVVCRQRFKSLLPCRVPEDNLDF